MDISRELALRAHIRNLLLDYALTHLTTDYIAYTENAVAELLSESLQLVPLQDSTYPVLETELPESLQQVLKLNTLPPFSECYTSPPNVLAYIKSIISSSRGSLLTSKCWEEATNDEPWKLLRPMSPILTNNAKKETPLLGTHEKRETPLSTKEDRLVQFGINKVECEVEFDQALPNIGDLPQMRYGMDLETHISVKQMIETQPGIARVPKSYSTVDLASHFLRSDSPPLEILSLDSPPIFPRDKRPGVARSGFFAPHGPNTRDTLASLKPVKIEEEDIDMYKQHMMVVDGWHCYVTPSSPTPSLGTSSSQDIDELFLPSPPGKTEAYPNLSDARMGEGISLKGYNIAWLTTEFLDEYELPRCERLYGLRERPKHIDSNTTLSSFLLPLIRTPIPETDLLQPVNTPASPSSITDTSMVGQPPSARSLQNGSKEAMEAYPCADQHEGDHLHDVLRRLGKGRINFDESPLDIIINEKLDDKDTMLMDVPQLPPPNVHPPNELFLPTNSECLVKQVHSPDLHNPRALTAVKGVQSLNIELSWRPFNWTKRIPTHEELALVSVNLGEGLASHLGHCTTDGYGQIASLVDKIISTPLGEAGSTSSLAFNTEGLATNAYIESNHNEDFYIRTRDERRRLEGSLNHVQDGNVVCEDSLNRPRDEHSRSPSLHLDKVDGCHHRDKRLRMDCDVQDLGANRTDIGIIPSEDSGIYMAEPSYFHNMEGDPFFQGFSYAAEGALEPNLPEEMFPDLTDGHFLSQGPIVGQSYNDDQRLFTYDQDYVPFPPGYSQDLANDSLSDIHEAADLHDAPPFAVTPILPLSTAENTTSLTDQSLFTCGRQSLEAFLQLRARKVPTAPTPDRELSSPEPPPIQDAVADSNHQPVIVPHEVLDTFTLQLTESSKIPRTLHRYLASMEVMAKRGLLRCFSLPHISIDVVERDSLLGAHLILDPDSAVYFVHLPALPSRVEEHVDNLCKLSWQFPNILVVFEGFPLSSYSLVRQEGFSHSESCSPFSPPVIKNIKKLRRDVTIAEAFESKNPETTIQVAFALNIEEVALFIRLFGDSVEGRDRSGGILWGDRAWLDVPEHDGELDLSQIHGMNVFASALILSQVSLEELLEWLPERRLHEFGQLLGMDRIAQFNQIIARRTEAMQLPSSSPFSTALGTSRESTHIEWHP